MQTILDPAMPRTQGGRTTEALRRHYEIERELADRLRAAAPVERKALYRTVYNELFSRVPDHPQNTRKRNPAQQISLTERQMRLLGRFLRPASVYLEVGSGDCHLAMQVASRVRQAYATDVSEFIADASSRPANFTFILSDGVNVALPSASVDIAYSHQLMEHLHPDDAAQQLREIHRVLAPGGAYICVTPHRYSGPQDVSQYFETEAKGFHLKEYTYGELRHLFHEVGFASTEVWIGFRRRYFHIPEILFRAVEGIVGFVPTRPRRRLAKMALFRPLFMLIHVVGYKRPEAAGSGEV